MAEIIERFGTLSFHNEEDVKQRFVAPLLSEVLGWTRPEELLFEQPFEAFRVPLNRRKSATTADLGIRPDLVVMFDGRAVCFCEIKGPNERLDEHLDQVIAYCNSPELACNLALLTNGRELRVYNVHDLLLWAGSLQELDRKHWQLQEILSRKAVESERRLPARIQRMDLDVALPEDPSRPGVRARFVRDFRRVFESVAGMSLEISLPEAFAAVCPGSLKHVSASAMLRLVDGESADTAATVAGDVLEQLLAEPPTSDSETDRGNTSSGPENDRGNTSRPIRWKVTILEGESGSGKTHLVRELAAFQAKRSLEQGRGALPVVIEGAACAITYGVVAQVRDYLARLGRRGSEADLDEAIGSGDVLLLFDAFDEVLPAARPHIERELRSLIQKSPSLRVVVTTRPEQAPKLIESRTFRLAGLDSGAIERFATVQTDKARAREFVEWLDRPEIVHRHRTVLLVAMLWLLFCTPGDRRPSPVSAMQRVMTAVRRREQERSEADPSAVRWVEVEQSLGALGLDVCQRGGGYLLDGERAQSLLVEHLKARQEQRMVGPNLTVPDLMDRLVSTGLVRRAKAGLVFWHRAVAEHFAGFTLAQELDARRRALDELARDPALRFVLPEAVVQTIDPVRYVKLLLERDPILAGQAALALDSLSGRDVADTVRALEALCKDTSRILRNEAMLVLCQLGGDDAEAALLRLLDAATVDMQTEALLELVKRNNTPALTWLRDNLDWNESEGVWTHSGVAVIRALGIVGDAWAQSEILRLWAARRNIFASDEAEKALTRLRQAGRLTAMTLDTLLRMLFEKPDDERRLRVSWDVVGIVGDALPAQWVDRVLKFIESSPPRDMLALNASRLLEASKLAGLTELLLTRVEDLSLPDHVRGMAAAAAAERSEEFPLARWLLLAGDRSRLVLSAAIKGLQQRATWEEIEGVVLPLLQRWRGDPDYECLNDEAELQEGVFRLLAGQGRIDLLTQENYRPKWLYENALQYLTEAAVQWEIKTFAPLFLSFVKKNPATQMGVNAAFALAKLGHEEQGLNAVTDALRACIPSNEDEPKYYRHETQYIPHDVLLHAPSLEPGVALELIEEARTVHRAAFKEDENAYFETCTVEALEKVATPEARAALKAMYSALGAGHVLMPERIFRAFVYIGTAEDEPWLLDQLADPHLDMHARRRALEALSRFGTQRSVSALVECAARVDMSARVREAAVLALHHVRRRQGTFWLPYGEHP